MSATMAQKAPRSGGGGDVSSDRKIAPNKIFPNTFSGKSFGDVEHIVNADGKYLLCRYWKPDGDIRALVFHIHGYAEHCGRSRELAEKMLELGIFSFTHDHFAHGESEGLRGYVLDYTIFNRDMWQHIDMIKAQYPELPIFLYGHSMGGGLAVLAVHQRPNFLRGIMLSAAFIKPSADVATPFKVFLAKVAARIMPKVRVGTINPQSLSRDKKQIEDYMNDPLVDTDGMRAGFATQFLALADRFPKILPEVEVPMFVAHSEDDKVCDVGGSKLLIEVSKSEDKTFKLYKEPLHMLEHETAEFVESYFADVMQWLKDRI